MRSSGGCWERYGTTRFASWWDSGWKGGDTRITGAHFRHLKRLENLSALFLSGSGFDDEGCEYVGKFRKLRLLDIAATRVTDAGLKELAGLRLNDLCLIGTSISDTGLLHLKLQKSLTTLRLTHTLISDRSLKIVAGFPDLRVLNLGSTAITDDGLAELPVLRFLTTLDLRRTQISDAGLNRLKSIASLKTVYLSETRATDLGKSSLRQALPQCQVDDTTLLGNLPVRPVLPR